MTIRSFHVQCTCNPMGRISRGTSFIFHSICQASVRQRRTVATFVHTFRWTRFAFLTGRVTVRALITHLARSGPFSTRLQASAHVFRREPSIRRLRIRRDPFTIRARVTLLVKLSRYEISPVDFCQGTGPFLSGLFNRSFALLPVCQVKLHVSGDRFAIRPRMITKGHGVSPFKRNFRRRPRDKLQERCVSQAGARRRLFTPRSFRISNLSLRQVKRLTFRNRLTVVRRQGR